MKSLPIVMVVLLFTSCVDESKAPVVTFDSAGKGAYVKLVEDSPSIIDVLTQAGFNASQWSYSVEFIDGAGGTRVTSYNLTVEYQDVDGVADAGPVTLKTYPSSSFTPAASGNLGVSGIVITTADVTTPFGLTYADLKAGDVFLIKGSLVTDNGTFSSSNSSSTVRGTAFQGYFDIKWNAACPSDLGGTYSYSTTNIVCANCGTSYPGAAGCADPTTGTGTLASAGGSKYNVSDATFGQYGCAWTDTPAVGVTVTDVCHKISTGGSDQYGLLYDFIIVSVTASDLTIDWSNDYGDAGTTTLTRTDSKTWPLDLSN